MSFIFWSYLVGSLSLCFLSIYYLCIFGSTHRKRSSKFFLITPLTHFCRLPSTEWYVHMCFKTLFPASTPVLLCYILIICCISETQLYSSEVMQVTRVSTYPFHYCRFQYEYWSKTVSSLLVLYNTKLIQSSHITLSSCSWLWKATNSEYHQSVDGF